MIGWDTEKWTNHVGRTRIIAESAGGSIQPQRLKSRLQVYATVPKPVETVFLRIPEGALNRLGVAWRAQTSLERWQPRSDQKEAAGYGA